MPVADMNNNINQNYTPQQMVGFPVANLNQEEIYERAVHVAQEAIVPEEESESSDIDMPQNLNRLQAEIVLLRRVFCALGRIRRQNPFQNVEQGFFPEIRRQIEIWSAQQGLNLTDEAKDQVFKHVWESFTDQWSLMDAVRQIDNIVAALR